MVFAVWINVIVHLDSVCCMAGRGGEETKVMASSDQEISASLLPLHMQIPGPVIPSVCRTSSLSLPALCTGKGTLNVPKVLLAF